MLQNYQKEFIELALEVQALRFGQFTLKSGRTSPYFFNAGAFNHGRALAQLGRCFAQAIEHHGITFDGLFGPAYKGIPLTTALAVALNRPVPVSFNRKEAKAHGEGGIIMGAPLSGKTLIIDDVITAGTAKKEAIELIHQQGAQVCGIFIALDRQEKGAGQQSALQEISATYQIPIHAIIQLEDLIQYFKDSAQQSHVEALQAYQAQYGV